MEVDIYLNYGIKSGNSNQLVESELDKIQTIPNPNIIPYITSC